jgi:hypothetical protein
VVHGSWIFRYEQSTINNQQPTTNNQQPTINNQQPTIPNIVSNPGLKPLSLQEKSSKLC